MKEDVAKLLSAPNPNLEKAKEFKSKLEQINAIVAAQHSMNDSEVVPVSPDASVTKTSSRTSVASSKVKQSRSSSSNGGGVPVPQNVVKPTVSVYCVPLLFLPSNPSFFSSSSNQEIGSWTIVILFVFFDLYK